MELKAGDRIRITLKDPGSDETETLDAFVSSSTHDRLIVYPEGDPAGPGEVLVIDPRGIAKIDRLPAFPLSA